MAVIILGTVLTVSDRVAALEPQAEVITATTQRYPIEIPITMLSAAIRTLAKQTGLQFARFPDVAPRNIVVGPLSGTYTRTEALTLLLRGTGLTYKFVNERTVAIVANVPLPISEPTEPRKSPPVPTTAPPPATRGGASVGKKKAGFFGHIAGLFALCGPLLGAPAAYCQNAPAANPPTDDAPPADSSPQAVAGANTLQEVVVTAERRSNSLQTTPIAITAISGSQLQASQLATVSDLQTAVPALSVENLGGGRDSLINIRGIGASTSEGPEEAGILVLHDGLPDSSEGLGFDVPFYDIADTEVLRGPQGTFVGDNSTGGAIQITSANPNFRGINGYVDAEVATYSQTRFNGAVNLPISDTLAARLAFNVDQRGSFYFDKASQVSGPYLGGSVAGGNPGGGSFTEYDPGNNADRNGRLSLLWRPTDNLQSLTKIELNTQTSDGTAAQPDLNTYTALPGLNCNNGTAGPVCHGLYYSGYSGNPWVVNPWDTSQVSDNDINLFGEELRYTLPDGIVLRSMSGDQEWRTWWNQETSQTQLDNGYSDNLYLSHIYSEEIDAISPTSGAFSWIAGANWYYRVERQFEYGVNANAPYSLTAPAITNSPYWYLFSRQGAVFGQISWQFTHTLQLQIGARDSGDNDGGVGGTVTHRPNGPPLSSINGPNYVGNTPTGKVDLNWTPLPGQFFYVFAARGYKPGGFNLNQPPSAPETVNDYELGWKGRLVDGHILTQLGGYYMDYYNMIMNIFDPYAATGSALSNIPISTIKGVEFSMQSQLGHLGFNLAGAYNDSVLGKLLDTATYKFPTTYGITNQCASGVTPLPGNSNCTDYVPYESELNGEALPYSPKLTLSATLEYALHFGTSSILQPRVTYSYTSRQYASLFQNDDFFLMGTRHLWSAYLDYENGPWRATAFATNFTNELYTEAYTGGSSSAAEIWGAPRQLGLELDRTF